MNNPFFRFSEQYVTIIDQTELPLKEKYIELNSIDSFFNAIKTLKVRGAPAIGVTAGFAIALNTDASGIEAARVSVKANCEYIASARPTAVNLFYVLDLMKACADEYTGTNPDELKQRLYSCATDIMNSEMERCLKIAEHGLPLLKKEMRILTHCNTGMLATPGIGTALGIVFHAHASGKSPFVWVPETRPLLQGSRLTAFELSHHGIKYKLITDNMRGTVMKNGKTDIVITGADRIAANGDTANKIGTYESAVLAREHNVPFYIAAPLSTFDLNTESGDDIIIEERPAEEVRAFRNCQSAPSCDVYNPAFDITPASMITGIITEQGIVKPERECIRELFS